MLFAVEKMTGGFLADTTNCCAIFKMKMRSSAFNLADGNPFSPLLEEKRHTSRRALVAQRAHPIWMHGPRVRAGLAADDDPV